MPSMSGGGSSGPTSAQIQQQSFTYAADTGTANTYAVTLSPAPSSYTTGMVVMFKATNANTSASTINVNSLGAKTIKKENDQDLESGDIEAGQVVALIYDGTNFQMISEIANLLATQTEVQNASYTYAADAQASDAYAITLSPAPAAYATGQVFTFKANTANTGAATLNVNSLGAKTIKKLHDQDLADNDIEVGSIVTVVYDGTNFQMASQIANSSAGSSWTKVNKTADESRNSTTTFSTDSALTFAMAANTAYQIRMFVFVDAGAGNFKYQFTGPASPTSVRIMWFDTANGANASDTAYSTSHAFSGLANAWVMIDAVIVNGSNAGNFNFQWAQSTSNAANTTVLKGSYLEYQSF